MTALNFIIACNKHHTQFLLPFIWFAAKSQKHSFSVEAYVTDGLCPDLQQFIEQMSNDYGINVFIDNSKLAIPPQNYRFLIEPHNAARMHYIGDIDLLPNEDVYDWHYNRIFNEGYCYSNEIRKDNIRMSGLHCCNEEWFNLTREVRNQYKTDSAKYTMNDEAMLCEIARSSLSTDKIRPTLPDDRTFNKMRPCHGQHISLSRIPFKPTSLQHVILNPPCLEQFYDIMDQHGDELYVLCSKYDTDFIETFKIYLSYCNYDHRTKFL